MTWQSIKTAPRDGQIIILQYDGHVQAGYFSDTGDEWKWKFWCTWGKGRLVENAWRDTPDDRPSHWMPLPDPPPST